MKYITPLIAALLLLSFTPTEETAGIQIGSKAPKADLKMKEVSGKEHSLNDLKQDNGLLVVFSCNTCPFVVGNGQGSEGWQGRYNDLFEHCRSNKIGMVLVNSNEAKRSDADSFEAMKEHNMKNAYKAPYVVDANHVLADAFDAKTTPHVFLFDKDLKLAYKGAIDDNVKSAGEVKEHWLDDAIKNMVAGKRIDPSSTRQLGCSIKRVKT